MSDHDGLKGLAGIEDFAVERPVVARGPFDEHGVDWAAIKDVYSSSAYIARFMDESGLTGLMESRLSFE